MCHFSGLVIHAGDGLGQPHLGKGTWNQHFPSKKISAKAVRQIVFNAPLVQLHDRNVLRAAGSNSSQRSPGCPRLQPALDKTFHRAKRTSPAFAAGRNNHPSAEMEIRNHPARLSPFQISMNCPERKTFTRRAMVCHWHPLTEPEIGNESTGEPPTTMSSRLGANSCALLKAMELVPAFNGTSYRLAAVLVRTGCGMKNHIELCVAIDGDGGCAVVANVEIHRHRIQPAARDLGH